MDIIVLEDRNENHTVITEKDFPETVITNNIVAFRYYKQDEKNEEGNIPFYEWRIGTPCKAAFQGCYIPVKEYEPTDPNAIIQCYSMYVRVDGNDIKRVIKPIYPTTTLVQDFSELEQVYTNLVNKSKKYTL